MKKFYTIIVALLATATSAVAQSFTVHTKSGEAVTYKCADVDSVVFHEDKHEEVVAPRIGDFYYSDGTWSTQLKTDAKPIGIVFRVGIASDMNDRAAFYTQKDGKTPFEEFHGYVVALKDATEQSDGTNDGVWWSAFDSNFVGTGGSTSTSDFLGYTNTQSIVETAIHDKGELSASTSNYPAAYYTTVAYEQACPAPASSTGWFLPSAGQMEYIYNRVYFDEDGSGRSCIANSIEQLGDAASPMYCSGSEYWTSTEKVDSYGTSTWAYYFSFDSSQFNPGFTADYRKNSEMRVRSVLAF